MRIVIIGSNGQVGAEVALMLANSAEIDVRPVARSKGGSAFLRYNGIPVLHALITEPVQAKKIQDGADVIANFALALGTPADSVSENNAIIRQTLENSPSTAIVVFFSTLAVHGEYDRTGQHQHSFYGKMKLRNEQQVFRLAKQYNRSAYVLRLGHVAGVYQNFTQACHSDILSPPVLIIDPERHSNVVHTATIADALLAVGSKRAGPPGLYDLVNVPQWTWREVLFHEAATLNIPLVINTIDAPSESSVQSFGPNLLRTALRTIDGLGLKQRMLRLAAVLPKSLNASIKADHYVNRVRGEINELRSTGAFVNPAQFWPAIVPQSLPGLRITRELLDKNIFPVAALRVKRWPPDLMLI